MDTRLPVLDGWRATSILLVIASHWLPLGPRILGINGTAGPMGMALFFTLSGFLIVRFLAGGMPLASFALRRVTRIVPLCWAAMLYLALSADADAQMLFRNFLFVANLPPAILFPGGEHLWSICIEMQFYVAVAAICALFGRRGLYSIPVLCLAVTMLRIVDGEVISIVTWHRVDEILAGGTLALIFLGWFGERPKRILASLNFWLLLLLLLVTSHLGSGPFQYLRPYAGALLVGSTLFGGPLLVMRILQSRPMAYIADISYALYVIHGVLGHGWLGAGDRVERYLKRPLLIGITVLLAHISTYYFERPITKLVRSAERAHRS